MVSLERVSQNSIRAIELILHEKIVSRELLEELKEIVFSYPGESRLLFKVDLGHGKDVTIEANDRFRVSPSNDLIKRLEFLIDHNVICL